MYVFASKVIQVVYWTSIFTNVQFFIQDYLKSELSQTMSLLT